MFQTEDFAVLPSSLLFREEEEACPLFRPPPPPQYWLPLAAPHESPPTHAMEDAPPPPCKLGRRINRGPSLASKQSGVEPDSTTFPQKFPGTVFQKDSPKKITFYNKIVLLHEFGKIFGKFFL